MSARGTDTPSVPTPSVINQIYSVDRQAIALFWIAPMTAVSMAPPAPPAIAWETMPLILRLPDCAAATTAGRASVAICPSTPPPTKPEIEHPASDQAGNNVTSRTEIKSRRCLTSANSAKSSCDEVDQNLMHVDPPMTRGR